MRFWTNRMVYSLASTVLVVLALLGLFFALRFWHRPAERAPEPVRQVLQEAAPGPAAGALSLALPLEGEVVSPFGGGYSGVFGDFRFNRSVEIKGRPGAAVRAAASGVVEEVRPGAHVRPGGDGPPVPAYYAVAVGHEGGYRTIYRGLGEVVVRPGRHVLGGEVLGRLPDEGAVLEFALEKDGEALDPAKYLGISRQLPPP
ncbi:murein hydrolase activator EnvC family protein [Desulfovirgula thermocuniculi]|uniref:murein hydrolase activator EnvC family protein n=1 Tax=Desulfovirgula thermocuniculi TaxID=348842 RepID=UPI0003FC913C|nr:M23 family metallopeptidase [Desulfovirgula thermocuniculi]